MIEEDEITTMINNNDIDLTDYFVTVEEGIYRKIRNGKTKEQTPPSQVERRRLSK